MKRKLNPGKNQTEREKKLAEEEDLNAYAESIVQKFVVDEAPRMVTKSFHANTCTLNEIIFGWVKFKSKK